MTIMSTSACWQTVDQHPKGHDHGASDPPRSVSIVSEGREVGSAISGHKLIDVLVKFVHGQTRRL
jgi:hypothetical protein